MGYADLGNLQHERTVALGHHVTYLLCGDL